MTDAAPYGTAAAHAAAVEIRRRIGQDAPVAGIVLGSGLGGLAQRITQPVEIPFAEVPGFPAVTVVGHAGRLIGGTLAGRRVVALAGRFHMYEGHSAALAGFPVRVLHALGAPTLFVSNAAGGIRRTFRAGDLMLIRDHLNLMFRNPLIGACEEGDERFPDMSAAYDDALARLLLEHATALEIPLHEGVYCGLLGPAYETPAEVRMLATLGADVVGMSTVPEVVVARALGMRVAGVSCVTNLASGISPHPLSHAEVLETTTLVAERFEALVERFVEKLPGG
ncbi:MAG TPA: purine-nucleoside phosphorylase [Gemmatimonadaceae bacterium]|nr:purine-nucleoside phosphorylase [Gemmatimonadaceae bacterium]